MGIRKALKIFTGAITVAVALMRRPVAPVISFHVFIPHSGGAVLMLEGMSYSRS